MGDGGTEGAGAGAGTARVTSDGRTAGVGGGGHSGWAAEARTGVSLPLDPVDESMGLSSGSIGTDGRSLAGAGRESGASVEVRVGVPDGWAVDLDAGASVWHDLVLMLVDGQIGVRVALLGCVIAGAGVAIVAAAGTAGGGPRRSAPEMQIERPGEISVRRQEREGEPDASGEPEGDEGPQPEAPEPAQPEPERDPRLWSKPLGWISPPPGSRRVTPRPSTT